jgi:ubiquitin C-terminal hydrolase
MKNDKDLYQCPVCKKWISLNNRYICDTCHFSLYCSKKCAFSSLNKTHMNLHEYLSEFIIKKFDIKEFLKMELNTSKYNDGLVGLNNLGNTCFINSSLQCLFNTYDLSKYFLSNYFKEEINKKNKLGHSGKIAESYAELLEEVKTTISSIVNPKYFIIQFIKNNQSLNVNLQQDAQEFLSLLLDSLHEDLNRITNKPYIELEEQKENEYDADASKRWWDCHKKREDSIIIDLFHGQFKSKITCLKCTKQSITYEPYLFLGLPIPQFMKEQIIIKFFFGNKCDYLGIIIDEKITILDLKKKSYLFLV